MANQQIFCNTPWYEAHIYWDGSLGICCQESRKLYEQRNQRLGGNDISFANKFNIKSMSLTEWFNSSHVRKLRQDILSDTPTDICTRCYNEEALGNSSRRLRANQKSVIFTKTAFADSYQQSPGYPHFDLSLNNDGYTDTHPIDLHIDLGNFCNLACKMCWSGASTTIATQYVKWGETEHKKYLGVDWTRDPEVWTRSLNEILTFPKLKNIHFMGGETLLTPRFENFIDFMIAHNRTDISFSFVTNGLIFNKSLVEKFKLFSRAGVEVSIETTTLHNDYIRQGTDTKKVLENIDSYIQASTDSNITLVIRPAISALSVGKYYTLLEYCLDKKLIIKNLLVTGPAYLAIQVLPKAVKQQYLTNYYNMLDTLSDIDSTIDFNESDNHNYKLVIKQQVIQMINALQADEPANQQELLAELVAMCKKWDKEYQFNARTLYPELIEVLDQYDY